jgi:hypothetical membrane protein
MPDLETRSTTAPAALRVLLLCGPAAAVVLAAAILWAGALEPGYSHLGQFVSELGAVGSSHQAAFNFGGLVPAGLLTALFALGLLLRLRSGKWLLAAGLLVAVAGVTRAIAGIFPCDPGCDLEQMSAAARVHAGSGFVALTSGAVAPLALAAGLRKVGRGGLFLWSLSIGLVSMALVTVLFGLGPGLSTIGGVQRLVLMLFYGWVVLVAISSGAFRD